MIGQQYAERYGDKIRAMVIDSNMDHSSGTNRFVETEAVTAEDSFAEWVKWCDRTTSCVLHGKDVTRAWDGVLAKADRGDLTDPDKAGRRITAYDVIRTASGDFYGPRWSQLAGYIAALDAQKSAGAQVFAAKSAENPFQAVFCQDWQIRVRNHGELAKLASTERQLAPHMRGGVFGQRVTTSCAGWPDASNPQHRLNLSGAPRILMLNGLHDPATPTRGRPARTSSPAAQQCC